MHPSLKKVTPSFRATPSESWGPVKPPFFENLVGGSTSPAEKEGGGGGAFYDSSNGEDCIHEKILSNHKKNIYIQKHDLFI